MRPIANPRRQALLAVLSVALLAACGSASAGDAAGSTPDPEARRAAAQLEVEALPGTGGGPFVGRELDPPLVTPRFVLTDTAGETFDFARDATHPVTLMYFGYTSCPDVCPAHMAAISKALSELPDAQAEQVQVVFVSVDAVNDSPDQLRDYLDNFSPEFVGLTGTAGEVNAALRSVGLAPTAIAEGDQFPPEHPSDVLAYTADGRAHVTYPFGTPPSAYAEDIPQLIDSDWNA
ncbi:MAG TPA: SCO family protein [Euzebyales bacterium]|nr:SCO family protein [Euzebyales bacterium]